MYTTRTSYEVPEVSGDFIVLCEKAQGGNQDAIAALWPILYAAAYKQLDGLVHDDESLDDCTTEFVDRYLLGWINSEQPRGAGQPGPVPPLILGADRSFRLHFERSLETFAWQVKERKLQTDPWAAGVVQSYSAEDDSDDPLAGHEQTVGDMPDERVPTPEEILIDKDTLLKFRDWLPPHLSDVFDGARFGMHQEAIAYSLKITQGEVSKRLREIYELMPTFNRECL
jgi:hypothetical protein